MGMPSAAIVHLSQRRAGLIMRAACSLGGSHVFRGAAAEATGISRSDVFGALIRNRDDM
jgi:hypothetical protein